MMKTTKIRYLKQQDSFRCGPIAIINAMKHLGYPITGKQLSIVSRACNTSREGTDDNGIIDAIKQLIGHRYYGLYINNTIDTLDEMVKYNPIIIGYYYYVGLRVHGHYTLCIGKKKNKYILINDADHASFNGVLTNVVKLRTKKEITKMLSTKDYEDCPASMIAVHEL